MDYETMADEEPTLMFLRSRPEGWSSNGYIASSLQSLETSFLLIALNRFPHALATCVSAIENVLLAKFNGGRPSLKKLIEKAVQYPNFSQAGIDNQRLEDLRVTRNRIVHQGFSASDDSGASDLYIDVALPFLSTCYLHFYSFDISSSLLAEVSRHLRIAQQARHSVKDVPDLNLSYCLHSFGHLIRWGLKPGLSADWESDARHSAFTLGIKWDYLEKTSNRIEQQFGVYWSFDCPVCDEAERAITEISELDLHNRLIIPLRMVCVECNFVVGKSQEFLSKFLLDDQVREARHKILKEYGIS